MRKCIIEKKHIAFVFGIFIGFFCASLHRQMSNDDLEFTNFTPDCVDTPTSPVIYNNLNGFYEKQGEKVAQLLAKRVRLLCWVMTTPQTVYKKAKAVRDTWGRRCNVLLFMSSHGDSCFPTVGLNIPEGRENLWLKTRAAWKYVFERHYDDADWFLKVDDDTFVIPENLRHFLNKYNTTDAHYFGRHFQPFGGYNSGGSGYVFSQESLTRFMRLMRNDRKCKMKSSAEDKEVGVCLAAENIHPEETRDEFGKQTFHPFDPLMVLVPGLLKKNNWLYQYSKWEVVVGPECCSEHSISFHYVKPNQMYFYDFLLYRVRAFGTHLIPKSV